MDNVSHIPHHFPVTVVHAIARDADDTTMWVAECDGLHIVTEAPTYDALIDRVWELVPDMIEANNLGIPPEAVRLRFEFEDSAGDRRVAL